MYFCYAVQLKANIHILLHDTYNQCKEIPSYVLQSILQMQVYMKNVLPLNAQGSHRVIRYNIYYQIKHYFSKFHRLLNV